MGGHYYRTYKELVQHKNFKMPPVPPLSQTEPEDKLENLVGFVTEAIAGFVSPSPKEDDEDFEYSCNDLAKAIKGPFKKHIVNALIKARREGAR